MYESLAGRQSIKSKIDTPEKAEPAVRNISGSSHQQTHRAYSQHILPNEQLAQQHLLLHLFLTVFNIIYFSYKVGRRSYY